MTALSERLPKNPTISLIVVAVVGLVLMLALGNGNLALAVATVVVIALGLVVLWRVFYNKPWIVLLLIALTWLLAGLAAGLFAGVRLENVVGILAILGAIATVSKDHFQ